MDKILNFKDKETAKIYNQEFSRKLPQGIQRTALRKLMLIDKSADINDLKNPPGNCFEALKGDRLGQFCIRINDQYRVCFTYADGYFSDVEIVDYH